MICKTAKNVVGVFLLRLRQSFRIPASTSSAVSWLPSDFTSTSKISDSKLPCVATLFDDLSASRRLSGFCVCWLGLVS